jgi:squalene-associated FAD-dependent desaturase
VVQQLHIVGAGWSGLTAALAAAQSGWDVTLHEATAQAGGRARSVQLEQTPYQLDNGQHLLIGAYHATLDVLRTIGQDLETSFLRTPLDLRLPNGDGFQMRSSHPTLGVLRGILSAQGWSWLDRFTLIKAALLWQLNDFQCSAEWSVMQLCQQHGLTPRVMRQLIEPLCLSALNTPLSQASACVFLRVLHDAFFSGAGSCDLLIPRTHLSALWSEPCLKKLNQLQVKTQFKHRVSSEEIQTWLATPNTHVLLACPAWDAARLVDPFAPDWAAQVKALRYQSIATVYVQCMDEHFQGLDRAMLSLRYSEHEPAQFIFDHGLCTNQTRLMAAVVSANTLDANDLTERVLKQLQNQLGFKQLHAIKTIVEKRATFSCEPFTHRPTQRIHDNLWACGDYVQGPYPATLEGAVRSGFEGIAALQASVLTNAPK